MADLVQGAVAPANYVLTVGQGDSGLDLTTVSAAVFNVYKPGAAAAVQWTAALSGASPTALTLTHAFLSVTELDVAGEYTIYATLTVPGGFLETERVRRIVKGKFSR